MDDSITKGKCAEKALLAKAAALCGGINNLAYVLDTRTEDLCRWIAGAETVPHVVMREAFVVVSSIRHESAAVGQPSPGCGTAAPKL